jgi:hypothetical protein
MRISGLPVNDAPVPIDFGWAVVIENRRGGHGDTPVSFESLDQATNRVWRHGDVVVQDECVVRALLEGMPETSIVPAPVPFVPEISYYADPRMTRTDRSGWILSTVVIHDPYGKIWPV